MSDSENKTFKELEEDRRRTHILEVAERLFARSGFHETSVGDIAKEAGFGVGTLYKYFKDKDELFQSLLEWRIEQNLSTFDDILNAGGTPVEKVERIIDSFIDNLVQRADYMMLYLTYIHPRADNEQHGGKVDFRCIRDCKNEQMMRFEAVFQQGIDQGLFMNVPAHYLAGSLHGILMSMFFTTHFRLADQWDLAEVKSVARRIFFEPVLRTTSAALRGGAGTSHETNR